MNADEIRETFRVRFWKRAYPPLVPKRRRTSWAWRQRKGCHATTMLHRVTKLTKHAVKVACVAKAWPRADTIVVEYPCDIPPVDNHCAKCLRNWEPAAP